MKDLVDCFLQAVYLLLKLVVPDIIANVSCKGVCGFLLGESPDWYKYKVDMRHMLCWDLD